MNGDATEPLPLSGAQSGEQAAVPWPYIVGLVGACAAVPVGAGLAGLFGLAEGDATAGFMLLFWLAPIPYLGAWLVLACPSVPFSLLAVLLLVVANGAVLILGFIAGLFTFGILALPAIVGGGFMLGSMITPLQRIGGLDDKGPWTRIHRTGCLIAGAGLLLTFFIRGSVMLIPPDMQATGWQAASHTLVYMPVWLCFFWHARTTWAELQAGRHASPGPVRAGAVVLAACILSFWLFAEIPGGSTLKGGYSNSEGLIRLGPANKPASILPAAPPQSP